MKANQILEDEDLELMKENMLKSGHNRLRKNRHDSDEDLDERNIKNENFIDDDNDKHIRNKYKPETIEEYGKKIKSNLEEKRGTSTAIDEEQDGSQ